LAKTQDVRLSIDASKTGAKIDRNLFGQFAEQLGYGVYGGIWVGPDSAIPNTRGIRKDVVEALRAIKVPNVRWPGGCYADEHHWRRGIGPQKDRTVTLNAAWGGVPDTYAFGTDEYMDFLNQIGSQAYVSANIGSGTVEEASEWVEYMTANPPDTLGKLRAANGHPEPYKVKFLGIGNESWDCGGVMTPEYYISQLKLYTRFVHNYNPAQKPGGDEMLKIAVGPGFPVTDWTAEVMKAWKKHDWAWDFNGLSVHWYTVPNGWPVSTRSDKFSIEDYDKTLKSGLFMDEFLRRQEAVMDQYDPEKKVALVVDEWGAWHAPLEGTNKDFLIQQNSLRDAILAALNINIFARHADRVRMANIAQMINVLQSMILTDKDKMVLTPTYWVFKMYVPFQDARFVPVTYDAGTYTHGGVTLPRIDAIAAKSADGKLQISITNLDPINTVRIDTELAGMAFKSAHGETLTAPAVDSINTFGTPNAVEPKPIAVQLKEGKLTLEAAPKSVTVITVE
jgi:alpha-N-arabinofuranosidase